MDIRQRTRVQNKQIEEVWRRYLTRLIAPGIPEWRLYD